MPTPTELKATALAAAQATVTAVQNIVITDTSGLQAQITALQAQVAQLTDDKAGLQSALTEQTQRVAKAVALDVTHRAAADALTAKLTQLLPSQGGPAI